MQLVQRFLRESFAGFALVDGLVLRDQLGQVFQSQLVVELVTVLIFDCIQNRFEMDARNGFHDIGEHLDETAVAVESESRVLRLFSQTSDRCIVQPQIQDCVHHARHREGGTGTDRHQQRVGRVMERFSDRVFQVDEGGIDLLLERSPKCSAFIEIMDAGFRRDRESWRDGQAEIGHLGEVGAFASQQHLLFFFAF